MEYRPTKSKVPFIIESVCPYTCPLLLVSLCSGRAHASRIAWFKSFTSSSHSVSVPDKHSPLHTTTSLSWRKNNIEMGTRSPLLNAWCRMNINGVFKKTHTSIYPCCWRLFVCLTGIYIYKALRHSHSMIRSFFKGTAQKTRRRRTTTIVFHTKHFFSKRSIPIIIYFSAASHSWHSFFHFISNLSLSIVYFS